MCVFLCVCVCDCVSLTRYRLCQKGCVNVVQHDSKREEEVGSVMELRKEEESNLETKQK